MKGDGEMEINDLIIFQTVANEGTISKAAKELGYVQPNITERIKKLEQELETQLIHRNNKGISLLPAGEILLEYTDKIIKLLDQAKSEIKRTCNVYRIATTQSILGNYLSNRIGGDFNKFQIFMENSNHLQGLLEKKKVDMVITYLNFPDPAFQKVFSTSVTMGLLKAKGKPFIDLSNEVFFASNDKHCPYRIQTIAFMEEHNLSRIQLQQVDSYSLIEEFVAQGKGLAFLAVKNDKLEKVEDVKNKNLDINFFINGDSDKQIPKELLK